MVGASAMGPQPFEVTPSKGESEEEARERVLKRFEKIGLQIMNRTGGGGPVQREPDRVACSATGTSVPSRPSSSARRTSPRTTSCSRIATPWSTSPPCCRRAARSSGTSC